MKLTSQQEDQIKKFVDGQGVKLTSLRDDVLDHLCCVVESQLNKGKSFETLLKDATEEVAPHGLHDIEKQTIFLLNTKRIIIMKKLMYIIGFIGSVVFAAGVALKLLRLSMGTELFIAGFLILLLVFVPLMAMDRYKVAIAKALSERLKIMLGGISGIIVGLSGLFKLLHLQGAELLLMLGMLLFIVGFLPFLFFRMYKHSVAQHI
jgi:hypothetical protein